MTPRRIADAGIQDHVRLTGTIRAASTIMVGSSPTWRCVLADGSGELDLLFLGQVTVAGLAEGARCTVAGVTTSRAGRLAIWAPHYELGPGPEAEAVTEAAGRVPSQRATAPAAAEQVEAAGHFRIYLGVAAGVGKTVAMLDEGHRRRDRGTDLVIGFVESHGRPVTRSWAEGLEIVPRRTVTYRGSTFEEMDTAAVLRRRPAVALVDELAHTNVPGAGGHAKRWQDVLELLEAGIDVVTTVNIQHLESIADTVEAMTGTPVAERVPDWVIRRANQIELIDSSPEQLRRRMLHGNIYPPEDARHALAHFFRADNLTALRELALRFMADQTDEHLLEQVTRHRAAGIPGELGTAAHWETTERIMAGVTSGPGSEAIIRRAARIAARVKGRLDVVHIASGFSSAEPDPKLDQLRQVAEAVGASWHHLSSDEPAGALIDFAVTGQITQIVLGSSQRSRWRELMGGGSIVSRVTRQANRAGIDVHIVAARLAGASPPPPGGSARPPG